ncbi:hypothetical protein J1TS5_35760 [Paenibacillus macerans]|nr:hypothetical protein [Paenibacillus macerans]GIP11406.1 hypothetical protein J1TS5_35760 [Paenibacillus macerans]
MQLQGNRIIVKNTEGANAICVTCINPGELATQMPYEAGAEAVWSVYRGA